MMQCFAEVRPATGQKLAVSNSPICVYIIDDDDGVRRALARVFKSAGIQSHQFASTKELFASRIEVGRSCVVADLNIVGDEPIDLPDQLKARHIDIPVIFVSADDSDANRARVRSVGGLGLFRKPVDSQALIDSVLWAVGGC